MDNDVNLIVSSPLELKRETLLKRRSSSIYPTKAINHKRRGAADHCEVHLSSSLLSIQIFIEFLVLGFEVNLEIRFTCHIIHCFLNFMNAQRVGFVSIFVYLCSLPPAFTRINDYISIHFFKNQARFEWIIHEGWR